MSPTRRIYASAKQEAEHDPYVIVIDDQEFSAQPWRMNPSQMVDVPGIAVTGDSRAMWEAFKAAMSWPFRDDDGVELDVDKPELWDVSEFERFRAYVQAPGRRVEADVLAQILSDLIEAGTGRPTRRSAS